MKMTSTRVPGWTYAFAAAALVLSLASLSFRYRVERANRAIGLAVEAETVESLGAAQGLTFAESLRRLHSRGLNALVISEETIGEMIGTGRLKVEAGPRGAVSIDGDGQALERADRGLQLRFPGKRLTPSPGGTRLLVDVSPELLRMVAAGIDPEQVKIARAMRYMVIARCANPVGASDAAVTGTLEWVHELGATVFLPMGDQVLGRRDAVQPFIDKLRSLGMLYASPEFAKLGGDQNVLEKVPDIAVRLHSAQTAELDKMTLGEAIERYGLAGSERDVRLLLLRPLALAGPAPLTGFGDFAQSVGRSLEREGAEIKPPHPYRDPGVPRVLWVALGIAIAGVATGLLATFLSGGWQVAAALALTLVVGVGSWSASGRPIAALVAAIALPTLAFLMLDARKGRSVVMEYFLVSFVSLLGGLCVAAMLNELPFFVRADQFMGVKAAQFAPILIVALVFFARYGDIRDAARSPILWGQAFLGLAILGALGLMWMRSGNDNPAAVSGLELKFRSLLDALLVVRPRTKEILLGHPAMVVAIGMLIRARAFGAVKPDWGGWLTLALTVGAIGQTSIVNTLCHLHTPLEVGLVRILVGLVLGGIIGLVLWAVVQRWVPKESG